MQLSIVVPVYNEEKRMTEFLSDLETSMEKLSDFEVVFVNDGSTDGTLNILNDLSTKRNNIRVVTYPENQGKGYAVRKGVDASTGEKIIFIDADNSTSPKEIENMLPLLEKYDVVVGDRTLYESTVEQPLLRRTTGKLFNFYANVLFGINVRDNLCGFKGFKNNVAKDVFQNLMSKRWIFDVELFYKIRKKGYTMTQMSIKWTHKGGTKIKFTDPPKMFLQLLLLRLKLLNI